jgi:hypothetical protein
MSAEQLAIAGFIAATCEVIFALKFFLDGPCTDLPALKSRFYRGGVAFFATTTLMNVDRQFVDYSWGVTSLIFHVAFGASLVALLIYMNHLMYVQGKESSSACKVEP